VRARLGLDLGIDGTPFERHPRRLHATRKMGIVGRLPYSRKEPVKEECEVLKLVDQYEP
jgi:hypothetical protein